MKIYSHLLYIPGLIATILSALCDAPATFAEFRADLIRMRTREGMAVVRTKGKLRGKKLKLSDRQQKDLCRMYDTDAHSISDCAEMFSISQPTAYRTLDASPLVSGMLLLRPFP